MAKLLVYLDDERHADLKELAHRHKTTMADLVRYAIEKTYEDQLDVVAGERSLEEYLKDPSTAISLDDLMKEMGVAIPDRGHSKGSSEPKTASTPRRQAAVRSHQGAR